MNLLDTASLVVTPNGYKASKLYSIIPSDGTGDMTFARTGNTATRVNPSGLIEVDAANIPRLDYTDSTCPKLLLEPQRTNVLQRSQEFDNAYWSAVRATITANSTVSPDGTQNADTFVSSSGQSNVPAIYTEAITFTGSTAYTTSLFVKKIGTQNNFNITYLDNSSGGGGAIKFNVSTLALTITQAPNSSVSGKITDHGNGWFRLQMSFTTIATPTYGYLQYTIDTALTTNGFAIWGAQLEAGAFATSYIPTTSASVTRNADGCEKTSISSLIGQTEGTVFFDVNIDSRISFTYLFVRNSATTNYIGFAITNTAIKGEVINSNATQANISYTANLGTGRFKLAIAYKANDIAFYVNGSLVGVDTSGTIPACDILQLYYNSTNGLRVNSGVLWKTRLQNSELATLTTL
jgi:hypothetical protein